MTVAIAPPDHASLLAPLLPALPAAAASTHPATKVLPLLSPILRQRVQLLSASSSKPWLRLLCYDAGNAGKLAKIARSPGLDPHPVSGEVEVDWSYEAETRYRRRDAETLQALVALSELGLAFLLVYCVNDQEGGGDGWRVGEVTVTDRPSPFSHFDGVSTIAEAERQFNEGQTGKATVVQVNGANGVGRADGDDGDDDDDYWGRYDASPARTPAAKRSPAPQASRASQSANPFRLASAEDEYFAQYDQVQPAMDNYDPDEEAQKAHAMTPLGLGRHNTTLAHPQPGEAQRSGLLGRPDAVSGRPPVASGMAHPRPESSASSNGSHTVARLEETAGKQEQNEFGVKQHVSRSIRSLYMLSRASGVDRDEFERLVKTELDLLGMMEDLA
ncbi:Uncharacterized protein TCAP_04239 [Tolypocladium capitatum]|uniref:Uncharacterized protein n=1 Tax=Tolypocladium capitatum TaxID=45235 RepID=A0A2K3QE58_9HYPO|nr:Uncharacterized protein TCAP_04239 [Tolypocladium capitatum]